MIAILEAKKAGLFRLANLQKNLLSGFIVGVLALPLAMAFAIASGAKPEQGIYTAIIAGFIVSIFGGSRLQIAGPTGAFVVLLLSISTKYGFAGLQIATLMAGVILLLLGISKLGGIIRFIPSPVITGFTAGIGIIIFFGQWQEFFGLSKIAQGHFHTQIASIFQSFVSFHLPTAALGIISLLLVIFGNRIKYLSKVPTPLTALVIATIFISVFPIEGVRTIGSAYGEIPSELPAFALPDFNWQTTAELIGPAFAIAMLGAIESLLSAVVADSMAGTRHNSNQELIGQGIANIVCPLFGGFAATGAIARTVSNIRNGGNSPLSGIIHSVTLVVILIALAPLASKIPLATLSSVLFVIAWKMSDVSRFVKIIKRTPRADIAILLITFLLTIFTDLVVAVNIGVILSTLYFMKKMASGVDIKRQSRCDVYKELGYDKNGNSLPDDFLSGDVLVFSISGPIFFGDVDAFEKAIDSTNTYPKTVIIRLKWVPHIDATGLQTLEGLIVDFQKKGVQVMLSGANRQAVKSIFRSDIINLIGRRNYFRHFRGAIKALQSENKVD